ncbi:MAG: VWA domain-containing protein [Acidobacteriota bacterium]
MKQFFLGALCTAFALSTFPASAVAQEQSAPQDVYAETVNVEIVNIEVYVTDKAGNPIRDLSEADFEMLADGKVVPISNFYTVKSPIAGAEGGIDAGPEEAEVAEAPEPEPVAEEAQEVPPDQRLHVVVYIDNFNLTPFKRNRVLVELRQFLRNFLSPDDKIMLATYDRELNLRHPFTARPENINRALIEIEDISAQRIHRVRERVDLFNQIEEAETVTEALMFARNYAGSVRNDTSFTIDALRSIVDNLAGSRGRKAIIYVSEGLPMIAGEDIFYQVNQKWREQLSLNEAMEYDMSSRYRELANQANANRVSFYTIDARGLTVLAQGTVETELKGQAGERTFIDSVQNSNLQSTVQMLAERTGGRAIINANKYLPDLRKIAVDFSNFYSLGYALPDVGDGRYHSIEIRLRDKALRKKYSIRHRDGFRAKTVDTRMHDGTLSALNLDLQDNPLGARLEFGPPKLTPAGNLYTVPMLLRIPMPSLAIIPQSGLHRGKLRLWFAAKDEKDELSDVAELEIPIDIRAEDWERNKDKEFLYRLNLDMEPGYHDIALGIRDTIGAQSSFIRRGIPVGG